MPKGNGSIDKNNDGLVNSLAADSPVVGGDDNSGEDVGEDDGKDIGEDDGEDVGDDSDGIPGSIACGPSSLHPHSNRQSQGSKNDNELERQALIIAQRSQRTYSPSHINLSYEQFAQLTQTITQTVTQALARAADQMFLNALVHNQGHQISPPRNIRLPQSLLNFPVNLDSLDTDGDHDEEDNHAENRRQKTTRHAWTPEDRQRLREMKRKGWTDERIGRALGRSPGAISQQWRKQK